MRIAVWKTGHEIADTVADAVYAGMPHNNPLHLIYPIADTNAINRHEWLEECNLHMGYGILRGTADIFHQATHWVHLDRGYFKPSHYDGYYRISLRGTQQTGFWPEPDYERLTALKLDMKPWRGFDKSKPVLICPPTEHAREFFGYTGLDFNRPGKYGDYIVRTKGDHNPINFDDYDYVLTFNSSVGWQALQHGIPCVSDPNHSMVGSWFKHLSTDDLAQAQYADREKLFATMAALQMTLSEIRQGKLWPLLNQLLSGSGTIPANHIAPTSPLTASRNAPDFQSQFASSNTAS